MINKSKNRIHPRKNIVRIGMQSDCLLWWDFLEALTREYEAIRRGLDTRFGRQMWLGCQMAGKGPPLPSGCLSRHSATLEAVLFLGFLRTSARTDFSETDLNFVTRCPSQRDWSWFWFSLQSCALIKKPPPVILDKCKHLGDLPGSCCFLFEATFLKENWREGWLCGVCFFSVVKNVVYALEFPCGEDTDKKGWRNATKQTGTVLVLLVWAFGLHFLTYRTQWL